MMMVMVMMMMLLMVVMVMLMVVAYIEPDLVQSQEQRQTIWRRLDVFAFASQTLHYRTFQFNSILNSIPGLFLQFVLKCKDQHVIIFLSFVKSLIFHVFQL